MKMFEFFNSVKQSGVEHLGLFRKSKRKCKRVFRADLLRMIMGCNSESKKNHRNPVPPIILVMKTVQSNTAPEPANITECKNEIRSADVNNESVSSKTVVHSRSDIKDKWHAQPPLSPKSEETANKLLILGVSGLSPLVIRRSPSTPSLINSVGKGGVDLRLPQRVRRIPSSKAPEDDETGSDPALLDAIAATPSKSAAQLNRSGKLSHRRSHSVI